jgi:hypothetical protein
MICMKRLAILIILFVVLVSGCINQTTYDDDIIELEETRLNLIGKMSELGTSLSNNDVETSRKLISAGRIILNEYIPELEYLCNNGIFNTTFCEYQNKYFNDCLSNSFNIFYEFTYLIEKQSDVISGDISINQYQTDCIRIVSEYNILSERCSTIQNIYEQEETVEKINMDEICLLDN